MGENAHEMSMLKNGKTLINLHVHVIEEYLEKEVESNQGNEDSEEINREPKIVELGPKDYILPIPFPSVLKSSKEKPKNSYLL